MEERIRALRPLLPALEVAAGLLILLPLGDWAANVWPLRLEDFRWRYGAAGLMAGFALTPLLGVLVLAVAAALGGQRRVLRLVGWTALLTSVGLLAAVALFALDSVQVAAGIGAESRPVLAAGALKAAVKLLLAAGWLVLLGAGTARAARVLPARVRARGRARMHVAEKVVAARSPVVAGNHIPARPPAVAAR